MNYIQKMVIYTIFTSIIFQIIPKKQYEKYIRFYMGLLLLSLLFVPMFQLLGMDEKMEQLYQSYENQWVHSENVEENKQILYQQYEENIGEELKSVLEKNGYEIQMVKAKVNQKDYGKLEQVTIVLKGKGENTMETVAPIEIGRKEKEPEHEVDKHMELRGLIQTLCQQEEMEIIIQSSLK